MKPTWKMIWGDDRARRREKLVQEAKAIIASEPERAAEILKRAAKLLSPYRKNSRSHTELRMLAATARKRVNERKAARRRQRELEQRRVLVRATQPA